MEQGLHEKARKMGLTLDAYISHPELPFWEDEQIVWRPWPMILPYDMVSELNY